MKFVKMHGTGNDYIFVDCFDFNVDNMSELAVAMSDRHYGIGGDGAIFLYPSFVADARMRMFNSDGSEGAMCGNALRCIGRLLLERKGGSEFSVETNSGVRSVVYDRDTDLFTVDMGKPKVEESRSLFVCGRQLDYTFVSMGNPHCVVFVPDAEVADMRLAEAIEHHSYFPDGINVEYVSGKGNRLKVRVWERGSGETLSCGTGACAAAAAAVQSGIINEGSEISVSLKGGMLQINYSGNIFLTGNAVKIYEGEYYDQVYFCNRRRSQRTR